VIAEALDLHAAFAAPSLPPVPEPAEARDEVGVSLGVAVLSRWSFLATNQYALPCTQREFKPVAVMAALDYPGEPMHVFSAATAWEPAFAADHEAQTSQLAELVRNPALESPLPKQLDLRIDYVLARPSRPQQSIEAQRAFTIAEPVGGVHPSDHDAVVVDVQAPD
jgi:endonuclease/exonuclease/phosphatase family metal-dependent hydrolase